METKTLPVMFESLLESKGGKDEFLGLMRSTSSGTLAVSKLFASKIQSNEPATAIKAFEVLEMLLEEPANSDLRTEISRYKFLNEIIRILSPKYMGAVTHPDIKKRGIEFLRHSRLYLEQEKVDAVLDSLTTGGAIPSDQAESSPLVSNTEKELKRLLQSKDPLDIAAANALIKEMVEKEAAAEEQRLQLVALKEQIDTATELGIELLNSSTIDWEITEEVLENVKGLETRLRILTENTPAGQEEFDMRKLILDFKVLFEFVRSKDLIGLEVEEAASQIEPIEPTSHDEEILLSITPIKSEPKEPLSDIGDLSRELMENLSPMAQCQNNSQSIESNEILPKNHQSQLSGKPKTLNELKSENLLDLDFFDDIRPPSLNSTPRVGIDKVLKKEEPLLQFLQEPVKNETNEVFKSQPTRSLLSLESIQISAVPPLVREENEIELSLSFGSTEEFPHLIILVLTNKSEHNVKNFSFRTTPQCEVVIEFGGEVCAWRQKFLPPSFLCGVLSLPTSGDFSYEGTYATDGPHRISGRFGVK